MTNIYRGDDTNAFGQNFIKINAPTLPENVVISKAIFQCGPIQKVYNNPTFPILVNFSHLETRKLSRTNECYLQIFDGNGLRQTCKGTLTFNTNPQAIVDEPKDERKHNCRSQF